MNGWILPKSGIFALAPDNLIKPGWRTLLYLGFMETGRTSPGRPALNKKVVQNGSRSSILHIQ